MRISLLFFVFATFALSCKKDPVVPPQENSFSATVNGNPFYNSNTRVVIGATTVPGARGVNIIAEDANAYKIFLHLLEYDGVKTSFSLDSNSPTSAIYTQQDFVGGDYSYSKTGQLTITSFDKKNYQPGEVITGTFHFETDDSGGKYSVTNGQFSVLVPAN